jgi:hypothetical protein
MGNGEQDDALWLRPRAGYCRRPGKEMMAGKAAADTAATAAAART